MLPDLHAEEVHAKLRVNALDSHQRLTSMIDTLMRGDDTALNWAARGRIISAMGIVFCQESRMLLCQFPELESMLTECRNAGMK